ncbi:MAG: methyltransferase domain-containing protein [Flavobacteriales bacterium]|nr:methyltransferase domain-containing protein [Flavobacteriales bacterium]
MEKGVPSSSEISEYYDDHAERVQVAVGVNLRHRSIINRLERAGLKPADNVLEVGCGVGMVTGLILDRVKQGKVVGIDISDRCIRIARERFSSTGRAEFLVSDMEGLDLGRKFDFILLPDVLEHIPEEQHDRLFGTLEKHLAPNGVVCIHIPDPYILDWYRKRRPEALQIVDQSLSIGTMVQRFEKHGLILDRFERTGLWTEEPEYDWIEFRRAREPEVSTRRTSWRIKMQEWRFRLGLI